jgi:hypothetical protein
MKMVIIKITVDGQQMPNRLAIEETATMSVLWERR